MYRLFISVIPLPRFYLLFSLVLYVCVSRIYNTFFFCIHLVHETLVNQRSLTFFQCSYSLVPRPLLFLFLGSAFIIIKHNLKNKHHEGLASFPDPVEKSGKVFFARGLEICINSQSLFPMSLVLLYTLSLFKCFAYPSRSRALTLTSMLPSFHYIVSFPCLIPIILGEDYYGNETTCIISVAKQETESLPSIFTVSGQISTGQWEIMGMRLCLIICITNFITEWNIYGRLESTILCVQYCPCSN